MKKSYPATHLMVLFDRDGRILAGCRCTTAMPARFRLPTIQEVAQFDLPEGERGQPAREIDVARLCTTMKVDTRRRVLIARDVAAD